MDPGSRTAAALLPAPAGRATIHGGRAMVERLPEPPHSRRRWRWFRHEAIDLGDVVVQIFAVVIGILLALFINDWVTQRQQRTNVHDAMRAIRAELGSNRTALRKYAAHTFAMADAMRTATRNHDLPPRLCYEWGGWSGIGNLNLTDAAYQVAITTQALANMPFDEAQQIANIYGWQSQLQKNVGLDMNILLFQPQTLDWCAGFVDEIGRTYMGLDDVYSRLLGPAAASRPALPPFAPLPSSGK